MVKKVRLWSIVRDDGDGLYWGEIFVAPYDVKCPSDHQDSTLLEAFTGEYRLNQAIAWCFEAGYDYEVIDETAGWPV
jgi:hypothetical protein